MNPQRRPSLEIIISQIREFGESEYGRGSREMFERLAQVAKKNAGKDLALANTTKRTPKGAAANFVERVISKTPKTIGKLMESAETDLERRLSYQVVRLALERGKRQKRYKKINGKWLRN